MLLLITMGRKAFFILPVLFFAMLLIQGCDTAFDVPTPFMETVKATPLGIMTQVVNGTIKPHPKTLTPPVVDPDGAFVRLSVSYQPPDPIYLKMGQKLYVFPPAGWGTFGWKLSFDNSFFQLDSQNAPKGSAQGWWIWIPLKAGKSSIEIAEVPPPCLNSTYPCTIPQFFARLNVEVGP